jgi:hypothetical protein
MGFKKSGERKTYNGSINVINARVLSDNCIVFGVELEGISLYGLKLVETKDGERFISMAQTKGKDGKYYNNYFINLSDKQKEDIIKIVVDNVK